MFVLGIDIGTTGCKAMAVNEAGEAVGAGYRGYGLLTGAGGHVEQNPQDWIDGMVVSVRQATAGLDRSRIAALSLSTQAASSLLVDGSFHPLTRAITWMDSRAISQRDAAEKELGSEAIYRTSGWRAHAALDMAKGRWLAENEPDLFGQARWFVSTLEFANQYLTGIPAIDPTNAAMRQLMDIGKNKWDPALMRGARIDERILPPIRQSGDFLGMLTAAAAEQLGLHAGVKVYNGAHDQYCGALGAAILRPGELMLSTGTAWVTMAVSEKAVYSESYLSPGPHIIPGLYGALASLPTSGAALDWLKNSITGGTYADIDQNAAQRIHKCKDVYFYPYLAGACFPEWNNTAKATFLGLDMDTDKFDLALACMEGVAFQFRRVLDEYEANDIGVTDIRVMGGAVNSSLWLSILSAVCGKRLHVMHEKETPCIGAACMAGVGAGLFEDYGQAARQMNKSSIQEPPASIMKEHYQAKYQRYMDKWDVLKEVYGAE